MATFIEHFFNLDASLGQKVSPRERDPLFIVQEVRSVPVPVWTSEEDLTPGFDPWTIQPVAIHYTDNDISTLNIISKR